MILTEHDDECERLPPSSKSHCRCYWRATTDRVNALARTEHLAQSAKPPQQKEKSMSLQSDVQPVEVAAPPGIEKSRDTLAGVLRDAADLMVADHGHTHERHAMWSAMANLLRTQALAHENCERVGVVSDAQHEMDEAALRVAKAYTRARASTKPEEPQNLGTVVVDRHACRWVRTELAYPWVNGKLGERNWDDVPAVRVLHEGLVARA